MAPHPHWPLFDLRIATPRVELRYPDDSLAARIVERATQGIHDPAYMPFGIGWTDVPLGGTQERQSLQFLWRARAEWSPAKWDLPFATLLDGEVIGVLHIGATDFTITKLFGTGSWLGREFQGRGLGKEMRAAVLHFGFAGLGAERAETSAWEDNDSSLGVTRSLGYVANGDAVAIRRGEPARQLRYSMTRAQWEARRRDDIRIEGLDECRTFFGLDGGW